MLGGPSPVILSGAKDPWQARLADLRVRAAATIMPGVLRSAQDDIEKPPRLRGSETK